MEVVTTFGNRQVFLRARASVAKGWTDHAREEQRSPGCNPLDEQAAVEPAREAGRAKHGTKAQTRRMKYKTGGRSAGGADDPKETHATEPPQGGGRASHDRLDGAGPRPRSEAS